MRSKRISTNAVLHPNMGNIMDRRKFLNVAGVSALAAAAVASVDIAAMHAPLPATKGGKALSVQFIGYWDTARLNQAAAAFGDDATAHASRGVNLYPRQVQQFDS